LTSRLDAYDNHSHYGVEGTKIVTAVAAMPAGGAYSAERTSDLRSPGALLGVIAAHLALAWGLAQIVLHPERLPDPIRVALLPETVPEPDVMARPLPQAESARPTARRVHQAPPRLEEPVPVASSPTPDPAVVEPVPVEPPPVARAPEPEPLTQPVVQPAPVPEPLAATRAEMPPLSTAPVQAAPPPAAAPVVRSVPAQPPAPPPSPAVVETLATQPLFAADYLRNPKPRYPLLSRRLGEEGLVTLRVLVTAAGEPRQVELKESCGFPRLDQAAQEVVRSWRFVPAKRGESPVDAWVVVPIRFTLKG
jgi:protein TonB